MSAQVRLPNVPIPKGKWGVLTLFVVLGLTIIFSSFTVTVGPSQLAVRQVYLGPNKGIQDQVFGAGLHFVVPGYERLHLFPRDMQLLEFNDSKVSASESSRLQPSIRIQTSEGYQVTVDVTIAYRIVDPLAVIQSVGPGVLYETSLMVPRSDKVLRQKLGEMNSEDFYQGQTRRLKAEEARKLLRSDVDESGIQVWSVLVRHYKYDNRYQEAIEQRKLQDQTVFKNRAEAVAASREAEKNRVLAEGQALVEVEREGGRAELKRIAADADLYFREQIAAADLEVALAIAEGTRLTNNALRVSGADNMVALEMAEVMNSTQVIVIPTDGSDGVNPIDLDTLIRGW